VWVVGGSANGSSTAKPKAKLIKTTDTEMPVRTPAVAEELEV
jgi:hypothetical protein